MEGKKIKNLDTGEEGIIVKRHTNLKHELSQNVSVDGFTVEVNNIYKIWRPKFDNIQIQD